MFNVYQFAIHWSFVLFPTGVASITAEFGEYFARLQSKSARKQVHQTNERINQSIQIT